MAGATVALIACSAESAVLPRGDGNTTAPLSRQMTVSSSTILRSDGHAACKTVWWDFSGPCRRFDLPSKGYTVTFRPYNGLTFSEHIPQNTAKTGDNAFAVGIGMSDADITGTWNGKPFPLLGTIPCADFGLQTIPCRGSVIVYTMMTNLGQTMGTGYSPSADVQYKKPFPGNTCDLLDLVFEARNHLVWRYLGIRATPKNGRVKFPSVGLGFALNTHDAIFSGVVCYTQ